MPISWNEIKHRAIAFSKEWKDETREDAEGKAFWDGFFNVFGISRRSVASFEEPVKNLRGQYSFIDLFWRGKVLVEHKSAGKNLGKAQSQAFQYIQDLTREGRHAEVPRYVIVSDFARIVLHDLEPDEPDAATIEILLDQLHKHVRAFAFLRGEKAVRTDPEDPANIEAAEIMGRLHDTLKAGGYSGHQLERFLVRVLFCLFAEDTGIFEPNAFTAFLEQNTREDGSDLGAQLERLFQVLDTPADARQKNLDEDLAAFPYVNGELFRERLPMAELNRDMRNALLAATRFSWERISPAVFGSLFQTVMEPKERRQIGGHYTSERDIMKVIRSLFLDELWAEFGRIVGTKKPPMDANKRESSALASIRVHSRLTPSAISELKRFHDKLASLRFFDPACGCGNFLVLTYRELRALETEALQLLHPTGQRELDVSALSKVDVDQFHGIEIGEWPARIAEVALWLMDHQMNQRLSEAFGQHFARLPLKKSPHIVCGNALRLDWKKILPPHKCSFILGNPPFVGKHLMTAEQGQDMEIVWGETSGVGVLDYVTGWYRKAAEYIQNTRIVVGFVSTNSISQGEQVGALWNPLFQRFGLKIHFAHRTFTWASEARGKAHVHVVIIGFGAFDTADKRIYDYETVAAVYDRRSNQRRSQSAATEETVTVSPAKNISPYLVEGTDASVISRNRPISNVPSCIFGSKPTDGGHLIVEEEDRKKFLSENPEAKKYLRPLLCAEEYLHSIPRWCLWLVDASPSDIRSIAGIKKRIEAVREFRLASKKAPTRERANQPTLFGEIRQPKSRYVVIPLHTSETRNYIPLGYFEPRVIVHNSCTAIPDATLYHFGVLSSAMHMAWVRQVCGRLESRYRYSNNLVYNNYPWPENSSAKQRAAVEAAAQAVLDVREQFMGSARAPRAVADASSAVLPMKDHRKSIDSRGARESARGGACAPQMTATLADLYDPLAMPPALVKAHQQLDRAVDLCYRPQPFDTERHRVEYLFALYEKLTAPLIPVEKKQSQRRR